MSQKLKVSELKPHSANSFFFDDIEGDAWEEFLESVKSDINKLEELRYYWSKLMVVVAIDDNILNLLRRENFLIRMHTNLAFGYRSVKHRL